MIPFPDATDEPAIPHPMPYLGAHVLLEAHHAVLLWVQQHVLLDVGGPEQLQCTKKCGKVGCSGGTGMYVTLGAR